MNGERREPSLPTEDELEKEMQESQSQQLEIAEQERRRKLHIEETEKGSVPVDQLNEGQKSQMEKLEAAAEGLYNDKAELESFLQKIAPFLPKIKRQVEREDGTTIEAERDAGWLDMEQWQDEHVKKWEAEKPKPEDPKTLTQWEAERLAQKDKILTSIIEKEVRRKTPKTEKNRDLKIKRKTKNFLEYANRGLALRNEIDKQEGDVMLNSYKNFQLREFVLAKKKLESIDQKIQESEAMAEDAREDDDAESVRYWLDENRKLAIERQVIIFSTPEAYLYEAGQQLAEYKQVFDENGTIVETPYVKETITHVLKELKSRPVFIHGELSTGKTEFAKHLSRKYLSNEHLKRWEAENPKPEDPEAVVQWEAERMAQMEPFEVRGMRGLEKEDVLSRTTLHREEVPSPEEQVKTLQEETANYKKTILDELLKNIEDPTERQEFEKKTIEQLEEAYFKQWQSGIITIEQLSPIFDAMEQGRPVIIDEMNAIPHHVLIVLNDVINKKPGQRVMTPQGRQFTVEKGFCVMATGNWKPEDDKKRYMGRETLDAAYLSRFGLVPYDYLPQVTDFAEGNTPDSQRRIKQESELYTMMMVRLLDEQLGAKLPEGSLKKIDKLAHVARVFQNVFSGMEVEKAWKARGGDLDPRDVLKENVLAYRQLIPIIEQWKRDGFVRPLDDYIYLNYVSRSSARPEEMKYIYEILQTQGDFFRGEDWPKSTGKSDEDVQKIANYPIIRKMYGVEKLTDDPENLAVLVAEHPSLDYNSPKEIIEELFGPIPERKRFLSSVMEAVKTPEERAEEAKKVIEQLSGLRVQIVSKMENPLVNAANKKRMEEHLEIVTSQIEKVRNYAMKNLDLRTTRVK